jgi:outer membrane protein
VTQAGRGWDIAQAEYRAGMVSRLQVTDAELALRQSEFNYAQAVYDYLTAQARLDLAIGRVPMVDDGDLFAMRG